MDRLLRDLGDAGELEPPWLGAFIASGLARLESRLAAERILDAIDASRALAFINAPTQEEVPPCV